MARPSKYSPELCPQAIAEVIERDHTVVEVVRDLGVGSPETARNWVKQARRDAGLEPGPTTEEIAEIKRLSKDAHPVAKMARGRLQNNKCLSEILRPVTYRHLGGRHVGHDETLRHIAPA